jgi:hypothetical protein
MREISMVLVDGPIQMHVNEKCRFDAEVKWLEKQVEEREKPLCEWNTSIVQVATGRGFVVQGVANRYIITAGRCLSAFPACDISSRLLYPDLVQPAWCRFVDPTADIAALGPPRPTGYPEPEKWVTDEEKRYRAHIDAATPLAIAEAPKRSLAWVLLPRDTWGRLIVVHSGNDLQFYHHFFDEQIAPGSPIVLDDGSAIGLITDYNVEWNQDLRYPRLASALPGWLLRELQVSAVV